MYNTPMHRNIVAITFIHSDIDHMLKMAYEVCEKVLTLIGHWIVGVSAK